MLGELMTEIRATLESFSMKRSVSEMSKWGVGQPAKLTRAEHLTRAEQDVMTCMEYLK